MKKRSFFERLAGNLRFDDIDDDLDEIEVKKPTKAEKEEAKREVPVTSASSKKEKEYEEEEEVEEEEIGELPVDVYETQNEIVIQTLIAGVLPEHLAINITRDSITISGRREANKTISDDKYHYRELYWGAFERTVELPAEVEIDNAEAIERHGMLLIKLPKIDKRRKTAIKVKSI